MSRCKSCNLRLESFDDWEMCKKCISLSNDQQTLYVDPQHKLITDTKQGCIVTTPRINRE